MRRNRAFLAVFALCLALPLASEGTVKSASASAAKAAPGTANSAAKANDGSKVDAVSKAVAVPGLASARAELKAAKDRGPAFEARLKALADALSPRDSFELLAEFAPLLYDGSASKNLLCRAGQLALLLGRYDSAADSFEAAAFRLAPARDDVLLLRSARERLASGETDRAAERASLVSRSATDPSLVRASRLVSAWAALVAGRLTEAKRLASVVLAGDDAASAAPLGGPERREALFIEWAALPVDRPSALAVLAKEYPESPEYALASGKASGQGIDFLPLPHWYLSGLIGETSGLRAETEAEAALSPAGTKDRSATTPSPSAGEGGGKALRYQIGVFSKSGNAASLVAELSKKGFSASIEERLLKGRKLEAVVVQAGSDANATLLKLKDAGYEAYPLF